MHLVTPRHMTRVMSVVCTQQTNQPYSGKQLWWYLTSQPKEEKSQYWSFMNNSEMYHYSPHSFPSDPPAQSCSPSHTVWLRMHSLRHSTPFLHSCTIARFKIKFENISSFHTPTTVQWHSFRPSRQSSEPSQTQVWGMHMCPLQWDEVTEHRFNHL